MADDELLDEVEEVLDYEAMLKEQFRLPVKLGAYALEQQFGPDWVQRIELDRLDLESTRCCVLGQLFHNPVAHENGYYIGIESFREEWEGQEDQYTNWSVEHGFSLPGSKGSHWRVLTETWRDWIREHIE